MDYYADDVTVRCLACKEVNKTDLRYGLNRKYEDDIEIQCPSCKMWETGSMPLQNFDVLEDRGRRELTAEEVEMYGSDYLEDIDEDDLDDDEDEILKHEVEAIFYKSEHHVDVYYQYIGALNCDDTYYDTFAYVASAIDKPQLIKALSDHNIDSELLIELSNGWSNSEKKMLEFAWQCFTGSNLFEFRENGVPMPTFPTLNSILSSLDTENTQVVFQAIMLRYL